MFCRLRAPVNNTAWEQAGSAADSAVRSSSRPRPSPGGAEQQPAEALAALEEIARRVQDPES